MTRFAHMSDSHLGYRQYHLEERETDFYEAFREAIDKVLDANVDFLIHSGDLVNRYRSHPKPLKVATNQFKRLKDHGIQVFSVPGNHDIAFKKGALPVQSILSDLVHTLTGTGDRAFTTFNGIFIGGIQYLPSTYSKSLKKRMNHLAQKAKEYEKRILILHQGIRRFFEFDYQLTWNDLPRDVFDYVAMGHVHDRIRVETRRGMLAYAGATEVWKKDEIKSYNEKGKGIYIVDLSSTPPQVEPLTLHSIRPFLQVEIGKEELTTRLNEIKQKTRESNKKPILFLTLTGVEGRHKVEYYNNLVEREIGGNTLDYKLDFEFVEEKREQKFSEKRNRKEILSEYFKREEEAEFAFALLNSLISEGIESSKEKAEQFLKEQRE